ncbi:MULTISPECIES: DUF2909 family protein [Oceanimonas]|uniref:DUF2909 domain-containing protein n=1 Tax=Oceanimonas doudoroffii TaxID=84158 RepID=A0A233RDM7_9GAMM|nr:MULTISPECIES: DUF2909 family protein [Oceanimonas]NHH99043.1 hypothetical protein [Oceanimonas sp. MB9]OXY81503.1 hypothetical protein B6S08_11030 [Oceanimonas doudoroffii]
MLLKLLIVLLLLLMIGNLALGLGALLSRRDPALMARYIGRRLLFAVIIVILLILALATGLLTPNPTP